MKLIRILVPVALVALATPAWSATLTYPGAAPCDTTLQACITGAASGDVVEIATNTPIDENLAINKSLTLQPAAGFSPTIGGGATFRTVNFSNLGSSGSAETLLIERLSFSLAQVRGLVSQGSGHSITIRDNVLLPGDRPQQHAVGGDRRARAADWRRVRQPDHQHRAGIRLWAITATSEAIDYTVERNVIDTSLPSASNIGISADFRGQGSYTLRAFSNVIDRVGGCNCGANSGVLLLVLQTPQVVASLTNNTVNGTQTANGFVFRVDDPGATVTINLFNNIASGGDRSGYTVSNSGGADHAGRRRKRFVEQRHPRQFRRAAVGHGSEQEPPIRERRRGRPAVAAYVAVDQFGRRRAAGRHVGARRRGRSADPGRGHRHRRVRAGDPGRRRRAGSRRRAAGPGRTRTPPARRGRARLPIAPKRPLGRGRGGVTRQPGTG
ncbi:MAG: hypothetical protein IPF73_02390 [Betaproteobacteria bacterium]|nr:hypothetical protein [Betaproteobacteria bacterium]